MAELNISWIAKTMSETAKVLSAVVAGYDYNPGDSDLDNEQPIHVSMTLGDYRKAKRMLYELDGKP